MCVYIRVWIQFLFISGFGAVQQFGGACRCFGDEHPPTHIALCVFSTLLPCRSFPPPSAMTTVTLFCL